MKGERLSPRQIATLRHLSICCADKTLVTLTRDQREAMIPLWRRGYIEMWFRHSPIELPAPRGPFFGLPLAGERLVAAVFRQP